MAAFVPAGLARGSGPGPSFAAAEKATEHAAANGEAASGKARAGPHAHCFRG